MTDALHTTIRESPVGGSRIAWSYLTFLLVALVVGVIVAAASPFIEARCAAEEVFCQLGGLLLTAVIAGALLLPLAGWLTKLGWEWALVMFTGFAALPVVFPAVNGWEVALMLGVPLVAAGATWHGPHGPRWRPWVIGAVCGVLIVAAVWGVLG